MEATRRFEFGRYKGEMIISIIRKHPSYVRWCIDNVDGFSLTDVEKSELINREIKDSDGLYYCRGVGFVEDSLEFCI